MNRRKPNTHYVYLLANIALWFGSLSILIYATAARADKQKPTSQPAAAPKPKKVEPNLDKLLEDLGKIDPKILADRLNGINAEIKKLGQENANLQAKLSKNKAQIEKLNIQAQLLEALVKARQGHAVKQQAKPKAKSVSPPKATPPKMTPPPKPTQPAKANPKGAGVANKNKAASTPPAPINFAQHVLPLFRMKCFNCHNPDKAKGGLVLASHDALMLGGGSGAVLVPGEPEKSRLFRLVNHTEQPHMPPEQPKLANSELDLIRRWIAEGALRDATSKTKPMADAAVRADPGGTLAAEDGNDPPMPNGLALGHIRSQVHPLPAVALATSPVAPLLAIAGNGQIFLHHTDSRDLLGVLEYPEGRVEELAFSDDGSWLIAAGGRAGESGLVIAYDVETGEQAGKFDQLYDAALAAAVSPDAGFIAVGGSHKKVRVFDTLDSSLLFEITAHNDWIQSVAFSPDGLLLATADRAGGLHVWEADTGREIHQLRGHTAAIRGLSFRADSQTLASCSRGGTVRLWELENGRQIRHWKAHDGGALDIAFTFNGQLATCGADGTIRMWQQDGKKLREFAKQNDWVYRLTLTPEAKQIVIGTWTGDVILFDTATGEVQGKLSTSPKPQTPASVAMNPVPIQTSN